MHYQHFPLAPAVSPYFGLQLDLFPFRFLLSDFPFNPSALTIVSFSFSLVPTDPKTILPVTTLTGHASRGR
jgi:hypothetical protein